jgi:glyoxylase-like metal-dependent hydrolase (beta-lactamase superfamily II)/ferredoxin
MAQLNLRRPQNVNGDFYVDSSCIDCDTCRWMAPDVFYRAEGQSAVYRQPTDISQRLQALQALLSCPTNSIGTVEKPRDIKAAQLSIPILVDENVYHCGYHAESSYGAASYLIQLPEGNILVDSPRFTAPLVKRIAKMGGIRYMYLTHRDDVAEHKNFAEYFGCQRIFHSDDISAGTRDVEIQLTGDKPFKLAPDLLIIPVPGHTKGHTVLLYKNKYLFSGDHLAWSHNGKYLIAWRDACWYSWSEQIKSMQKLANYSFEWVLPGHGRRYHTNAETMHQQMLNCITSMEQEAAGLRF